MKQPNLDKIQNKSIGSTILEKFLDDESIVDLAENYRVNGLMIEEILRQEFTRLKEIISSKELYLKFLERNT